MVQIASVTALDGAQLAVDEHIAVRIYAYPHFIKPSQNKLTANRLTVTFQNGNSIGVNTDGYVLFL